MKKVDYIVVGLGIAGISFCEELEHHQKSFVVFDSSKDASTKVAAGVINPVVLKRFTPVWNAKKHLSSSILFYQQLSKKINHKLFKETSMFRLFKSVAEQNNWMVASDKKELENFLDPKIINQNIPHVKGSFGFGKVNSTGRVDTVALVENYKIYLERINSFQNNEFDYSLLAIKNQQISYNHIIAKHIVFCEGAAVVKNPYFPKKEKRSEAPILIPNKGEYLIVKSIDLKLDIMLKSSLFIIPLGNDYYKVGATYDRDDVSVQVTTQAREELVSKLKEIITCDFEVVDQVAGLRPTTRDRRPFLGSLNESKQMVFFNGLGTRGITAAPSLAKILFNYIENNTEIPTEINIRRIYKW